jgi:AraC-like DNA-binding protein
MSSDPLSDALGLVRARCLISRGFTAGGGPWALRFDARHRLKLHAAVRGECWLILEDQPPLRLEQGDLAVTNGSVPLVLASDLTVVPRDAEEFFATDSTPILPLGGDEVIGIAGHVRMDRCCEDLILAALPTLTRIRAADPAATVLRYLLDRVLRELSHPRPGSEFAGEQYAQLILVEVLRVALDARNVPESGWLRLVADADLRPALALMHERPAHPWRLVDLAQAVSMSRSTFATRFRTLSGVPPLTYLHNWRIRLAQAALRDTDATVASLASQYGYASESSFSHAFTRTAGVSPRRYRTLHRNGGRT